jgi:hypothetical protein
VASNDSTNTKKSSSNIKEHQIKPQNQTNGHQNDKSNSTSNLNNGSFSNKKRIETKQDSESPDSKKPKLSLNDYKVKKENPTTTNGAKQNYVDKIPKQISCLSLSSSLSNSDKTSSSDLIVPLPTVPLSNILSSSNFNTSNNTSTSKITSLFSSLSSNVSAKANMFAENEDEALAKIMSTKHSKRTLYTGKSNMNGAKLVVPKLYDLCVKVLIPTLSSLHTRLSIQSN